MKRILAFCVVNFTKLKGVEDGINIKLFKDFFIRIRFLDNNYYMYFVNVRIDRYKLKEPILIMESKEEEEIIMELRKILLDENIFRRIFVRNLDKFIVMTNKG